MWAATSNYLINVVLFLDAHQGSCMVLLTLALVVFAGVSCWLSSRNIKVLRNLELKRSRPYVLLETTNSVPFFGVKICNMGLTAARRVMVETHPTMQIVFSTYRRPVGFLDRELSILIPQKVYSTDLGTWDELKQDNPSMVYKCTVRYESEWGEKYVSECVLDYTIYENLAHKQELIVSDLAKHFEAFTRTFGNLASGFSKLHVLVEDFNAHELKAAQRRANLIRKKEEQRVADADKNSGGETGTEAPGEKQA